MRLPTDARFEATFHLDGFVHVPALLGADELDELRAHKNRFVREVVPRMPAKEVYYEDPNDPNSLKQLQQLWRHDHYFEQMMSRFRGVAELLLGESAVPQNLQYFNKPPGTGRATPPHQDGYYFPITPNLAVTLWLALEDVGPGQGRVRYVRGSHLCGLRDHEPSETLGFSQSIPDYGAHGEDADEVAPLVHAGDLLAHHSLTIHRAEENGSLDRSREALGFIYYAARCRIDRRSGEAYQEKLANELRASGRIGS